MSELKLRPPSLKNQEVALKRAPSFARVDAERGEPRPYKGNTPAAIGEKSQGPAAVDYVDLACGEAGFVGS